MSIDEMVQYFVRNKLKQYIRGNPIRFEYKLWALFCAVTGYCYDFDPYQGKSNMARETKSVDKEVVSKLASTLPEGSELYFDNFFTSRRWCTCWQRRKAQPNGCLWLGYQRNDEETAGDCQCFICSFNQSALQHGKITKRCVSSRTFVEWNRKKLKHGDKGDSIIMIEVPDSVSKYNQFMGSVDVSDRNIEKYRCSICGAKWYFKLFTYFLDTMLVNAWILYKRARHDSISNFEFRHRHLQSWKIQAEINDCLEHTAWSSHFKRSFSWKHRLQCGKCDIGFHIDWFSLFHSNWLCVQITDLNSVEGLCITSESVLFCSIAYVLICNF